MGHAQRGGSTGVRPTYVFFAALQVNQIHLSLGFGVLGFRGLGLGLGGFYYRFGTAMGKKRSRRGNACFCARSFPLVCAKLLGFRVFGVVFGFRV